MATLQFAIKDRSTTSHATVVIDDDRYREQNEFPSGRNESMWWMMGDRTQAQVITRDIQGLGRGWSSIRLENIVDPSGSKRMTRRSRSQSTTRSLKAVPISTSRWHLAVELETDNESSATLRSEEVLR